MNLMYKSKNKLPTEKMILDLLNGQGGRISSINI